MYRVHRFIRSTPSCKRYFTTPPVAPSAAIVPHRSVLAVTGPAASDFLQGLTTRKLIPKPNAGIYSMFLHAQGRVLFDTFIYPTEEGFLVDYDPRPEPSLPDILKRFVLRSHVKIAPLPGQWDVWQSFGGHQPSAKREWRWGPGGAMEPVWEEDPPTALVTAVDRRAPGMGRRFLMHHGEIPPVSGQYHMVVDSMSYTLHRVMTGVPEGSVEIPHGQALPFDHNLDMMGGIDFRKGCYVGQELTVRTYHTGVVRKRVWPVSLYRAGEQPPSTLMIDPQQLALPPTQTAILVPGSRSKGRLLCAYQNVGLAILPLPKDNTSTGEQEMVVDWEEDKEWRIMPRRPDWWPVREDSQRTL